MGVGGEGGLNYDIVYVYYSGRTGKWCEEVGREEALSTYSTRPETIIGVTTIHKDTRNNAWAKANIDFQVKKEKQGMSEKNARPSILTPSILTTL